MNRPFKENLKLSVSNKKIKTKRFVVSLHIFFDCLYKLGLGVVTGERSFFHENEQNDQEQSHRSEKKNKRIECVHKNIGTICKGTKRERND